MIFLVRHVKAGHRRDGHADDSKRPITGNGRRQADGLVNLLLDAGATGPLVSSPFTRCVQTLEPLAHRLGLGIETDDRLAENKPVEGMLELIEASPDGSVLCSHGDMIPDTIDALVRRGCEIITAPQWKKGSVWGLVRDGDGAVVTAAAWPPPSD